MNSLRNQLRRPTHPGAILREDILPNLKMNSEDLVKFLGLQDMFDVLQERKAVSKEIADCLAQKVGGSSESWLRMQASFDSWEYPK